MLGTGMVAFNTLTLTATLASPIPAGSFSRQRSFYDLGSHNYLDTLLLISIMQAHSSLRVSDRSCPRYQRMLTDEMLGNLATQARLWEIER